MMVWAAYNAGAMLDFITRNTNIHLIVISYKVASAHDGLEQTSFYPALRTGS